MTFIYNSTDVFLEKEMVKCQKISITRNYTLLAEESERGYLEGSQKVEKVVGTPDG